MDQKTTPEQKNRKSVNFKMLILRVLIGGFFVVVGIDKIINPYQNFLYVVQGYKIFPVLLEEIVARIFPWVEFFLGLFLVLGFWLKAVLRLFLLIVAAFILIISQALIRKLPIEFCGCFGGLFSSEIHHTLLLDFCLGLFLLLLLRFLPQTSLWSLDKYFENRN